MKEEIEYAPPSHILTTIALIRNSFDKSVEVYTSGSCLRFALLLTHLYPGGEILYNSDHAIYKYEGVCYDITGIVKEEGIPLSEYGYVHIHKLMQMKYGKDSMDIWG